MKEVKTMPKEKKEEKFDATMHNPKSARVKAEKAEKAKKKGKK